MLGWITKVCQQNSSEDGELLGSNGKFYNYRPGSLAPGSVPDALDLLQAVSFTPGEEGTAFYPLAETLQMQEEEVPAALSALRTQARARLSEKRYLHCFKVSKITRRFAEIEGYDTDKAEIAGLLHDIAKEIPNEENARTIIENGLPVSSFELGYHHILHAMAGYVIAKRDLCITDPDILDGIRYHNGRPAMGMMEKLTYIGDHIDQLHKLGVNGNYIADAKSLDEAIYKMVLEVNLFYVRRRSTPDFITECTMNYLLESIGKADAPAPADSGSAITDEIFDAALNTVARQSVSLPSVPNSRRLGGYRTISGKQIRQNCLVRSSALCDMTREDAAKLHTLGIDTVIDLRSSEEVSANPDRNTDLFRCLSCPLPTVNSGDYSKQVRERFQVTKDTKEKTFYLSEYLNCLSMEDLYYEILTSEEAVKSLRGVFDILLQDETHGVLLHCTSGKDRTGIAAALILLALGARLHDVREDYYASVVATFAETEAMAQRLRIDRYHDAADEIRNYNGIGSRIAESVYYRLAEEYGNAGNYLSEVIRLTPEQISRLREKYLED